MCDSSEMYEILFNNNTTDNQIINDKLHFINQLVNHRNLKIKFQLIKQKNNLATKQLGIDSGTTSGSNSRGFV